MVTIDELAQATATSVETLQAWRELGLLSSRDDPLVFEDIDRVRVVQFVQQRGVSAETVARASETQGDLLGDFVETTLRGRQPGPVMPLASASGATGLDPARLERLWVAAGLGDQHHADEDDLDALRGLRTALDAGLPEDVLVQLVRVFADSLGRVADAEARLFHHYVHERLRVRGLTGSELREAGRAVSVPLMGLIEPTVLYFHRKAFWRARCEDLLLHLAEDSAPTEVPGEIEATILFVDLSGFTALTEAMGDDAAARLMGRFSEIVRDAALRSHGRLVKQIGDEFMLAFPSALAAVACGLEIEAATSTEPQFPAVRAGAHHGAVLYREGDYVGATVNVAARVVAQADRHQFLVTDTVRTSVADAPDMDLVPVGAHHLKGITERLHLFEVRRTDQQQPSRTVDPVCLMELDPAAAITRLTWRGTDLSFCSDGCLRLFVTEPQRYVDA